MRQPQTLQEETMEESVEGKLQLFVVSNEIIYCCLLCSVVVILVASLPLAAAEHVASPQISETEIEGEGDRGARYAL